MDLKTKLAFALVSASLLSMAALGYFTYLWAGGMFLEDSQRHMNAVAESKQQEIGEVFERWKDDVRDLVARVESSQQIRGRFESLDATSMEGLSGVLRDARASVDGLRRVTLFDVGGNPLVGTDGAALRSVTPAPLQDAAFSSIQPEPDGSIGVVFRAWLTLEKQRVGLVEAVFDVHSIDRILGPAASLGETAEASLLIPARADRPVPRVSDDGYFRLGLPRDGADVAPGRGSVSGAPAAIAAALRGREEVFAAVTDHRGREVMAATRFLPEPGWGLVVQVDRAEVRQRADRLLVNMRDLGFALAAFAILGGTLFGLYLGRPIHKLVQEVDRIRHGEIGLRLEVEGEDEVAFLAMSLNEFIDQLDHSSDLFRLGELRVLVLDPSARNGGLLRDLLQNWNMRPTLVESGPAALNAIEEAAGAGRPLQLLLLDESVLETDAANLAARLPPGISGSFPIVLMSSKVDVLDAERLTQDGVGRILPKPVVASHLMEAILDAMGVSAQGLAATTDAYIKKTSPRKILLAEDNPLMQQVMVGFLENWGHQVTLAENGRSAFESVQREGFDLVLMDVEMPEMNGLEATAAIREREREGTGRIPVVALTAEAMTGDRERCLAAGMDDYISKPVDPKALYALIERHPARALAASSASEAAPSPVDWELARTHTGGDQRLLDELIEVFPEECRRQLEAMRGGIEQCDAQLLSRSAHSLRGAALIFGAHQLVEAARSMETLAQRGDLEGADPLLEALEREASRLNAALASQPGRGETPA